MRDASGLERLTREKFCKKWELEFDERFDLSSGCLLRISLEILNFNSIIQTNFPRVSKVACANLQKFNSNHQNLFSINSVDTLPMPSSTISATKNSHEFRKLNNRERKIGEMFDVQSIISSSIFA
jgi:hypothetical protein